uniref:AN1-type domain-containing protein n=2 Tax=Timema TaxID=61471 RepID=A0A7R9D070_TIMPO|nr:unnamed protein product [Timema douglasi]CAD7405332.1 unnamed protein product [Timema poppensis]
MELPNIGQQCALNGCEQLDFLPFPCAHCKLLFCKEHCQPDSHACSLANTATLITSAASSLSYVCSQPDCSSSSPVEMTCPVCEKHFCLQHRYHTCKDNSRGRRKEERMKVLEARKQFAVAKEEADKQVEATLHKARQKSGVVSKTALKVHLMRIKGKAVGPKTIPASERVYFMANPPASMKRPGKAVFVSKQWHLGRMLDFIAETLDVPNKNNIPGTPKLVLVHSSEWGEGVVSENMGLKIDELIAEDVLVEGETLFLEMVDV